MFEIVMLLITKIEQLLAALSPLGGIAVSEYVTEQGMWSALNTHWANVVFVVGVCGILMIISGCIYQKKRNFSEWPVVLTGVGVAITIISIFIYCVLAADARINLIHETTPRLQLLKMLL